MGSEVMVPGPDALTPGGRCEYFATSIFRESKEGGVFFGPWWESAGVG